MGSFDPGFYKKGKHPYDLPPIEVYKGRSTWFRIPAAPQSGLKPYRPSPKRATPEWVNRLSMTPSQAAQFRRDGSRAWIGSEPNRPQSAQALLSKLTETRSVGSLDSTRVLAKSREILGSLPSDARIAVGCAGVYFISPGKPGKGSRPASPIKGSSQRASPSPSPMPASKFVTPDSPMDVMVRLDEAAAAKK
jgi:hypothetical protein